LGREKKKGGKEGESFPNKKQKQTQTEKKKRWRTTTTWSQGDVTVKFVMKKGVEDHETGKGKP